MVIGCFKLNERHKSAQSAKSKAFHFKARICQPCNSDRTQAADREFDLFHQAVCQLAQEGKDPSIVFENPRYSIASEPYLNVFRYFAKLLCCHVAESHGPRLRHMSRFAIGRARINCVWLRIDYDWTYSQWSQVLGSHKYAAHGGLVVYGNNRPTAFHSTLSIGQLRYTFFSRLIPKAR